MKTRVALITLLFSLSAVAQEPPTSSAAASDQASVWFKFEWKDGIPWQSYSISVQSDGKTHFDGAPNPSQGGDTDPVKQDFVMSEANRQKIFDTAQKLNYFRATSTLTSSALRKPEPRR